jgi:uncharacterized protein HemX
MIMEFSLKQLSWIVIGALGIGGTGYVSMSQNIDQLQTKVAVVHTQMENQTKMLDRLQSQLDRIESKLEKKN